MCLARHNGPILKNPLLSARKTTKVRRRFPPGGLNKDSSVGARQPTIAAKRHWLLKERQMTKFTSLLAIGAVAFLAACAQEEAMEEEIIMVEPEPIAAEPTYNKY